MRTIAIVAFLLLCARLASAQTSAQDTVLFDTDSSFDVNYVKFDLAVTADTEYLAGSVELRAHANVLRANRTIQLSLRAQLSVDSIFDDGSAATFQHTGDNLFVTLNRNYAPQAPFDLVIYYHGFSTIPDKEGLFHYWQNWQTQQSSGIPLCYTESEPYSAKDWWPCKDNPADKLDSADLYFTCPTPYIVGSNGTLVAVVDHGSTQTFHWHESYPVDHYLLAFDCTQFDTLIHWHHWADGDSMKIMHFVFPNPGDTMQRSLIEVDSILDLYERWFGPYPFRTEKYGIAQYYSGGMENETLSFCNDADSSLVAHETAHQWFGDAVTCKTWNDCWLNEGFATYITGLYFRYNDGEAYFDTLMKGQDSIVTLQPGGTVHTPDSLLLTNVLDSRLVYSKGCFLLHMLRFVLGSDSAFFRCLREYVTGPLRYGVVSAEDFEHSVEKSTGRDLGWFFQEWVYGDGYPVYDVAWNAQDGRNPSVTISQTGSTSASPLFVMPIELEFIGDGIDTTVQVLDNSAQKTFGFSFSKPVTKLIFDPHNWLLDGSLPRTLAVHSTTSLDASYFRVTRLLNSYSIDFSMEQSGPVSVEIYDLLGRRIAAIPLGVQVAGSHSIPWQPSVELLTGAYFCRLIKDGNSAGIARLIAAN